MEPFDAAKATRVWQRVQGSLQQPDSTSLIVLINEEWQDATIYLHLSKRMSQKESQILRRLSEEEQSHAACLKGIYTLITGQRTVPQAVPPEQEPAELTLRKCYGREMRCLAEYEARSSDPEYGPIFARLAAQEREHCMAVLGLIGNLKKPPK